ncbi:MAG: hypothetical protein ACI841_003141, partial [Planctomycetota bacterium]
MNIQNHLRRATAKLFVSIFVFQILGLSALAQTRTYTQDDMGNRTAATQQVRFTSTAAFQIKPRRALVGDRINIYGRKFPTTQPTQLQVLFGTTPGVIHSVSERVLSVTIPASVDSGRVKIILPGGQELAVGTILIQGVSISPGLVALSYGQSTNFVATVIGATDTSVTWAVEGLSGGSSAVGSIDAAGMYTAPNGQSAIDGPYLIRASNAETGLEAYALVEIACTSIVPFDFGGSASGSISNTNERICYDFSASAGDSCWITTKGSLRWSLDSPDGVELLNWTGNSRQVDVLLPVDGFYKLSVRSQGATTGSYSLGLSDHPTETLPLLAYDTQVNDSITPFGDVDEWPFAGTQGELLTAFVDTATTVDLRMRVLDATTREVYVTGTGTTVHDTDDSEILDFPLPMTGDYLLQVYTEAIDTGSAPYTLALQVPGLDVLALNWGQSISDSIEFPTDEVTFEIAATAGDIAWISIRSPDFRFRFAAPDGTTLVTRTGTSFRYSEYEFEQTGNYRMHVRSRSTSIGNFEIGLSDLPIEGSLAMVAGTASVDSLDPFGDVDE